MTFNFKFICTLALPVLVRKSLSKINSRQECLLQRCQKKLLKLNEEFSLHIYILYTIPPSKNTLNNALAPRTKTHRRSE